MTTRFNTTSNNKMAFNNKTVPYMINTAKDDLKALQWLKGVCYQYG